MDSRTRKSWNMAGFSENVVESHGIWIPVQVLGVVEESSVHCRDKFDKP